MIRSFQDYKEYIKADIEANHFNRYFKCFNETYQYLKCMRKLEYLMNCKQGFFWKLLILYYRFILYKHSVSLGIQIFPNTFGKGLYIPHYGAIVVNGSCRFGDYCVIQNCINVSEKVRGGNHIYIGTGAKIMKDVNIADDVIVGANAVVSKSVDIPNVVVVGIPAKIISTKGFKDRKEV